MRRWRNTVFVDPRDLPDDWLADFAQHGCRRAPEAWVDECFTEWHRRGCPDRDDAEDDERC